jgi:hypothetical protein
VHGKLTVPSLGRLLQFIQRLAEKANTIGLRRINKSSRLAAIDGLQEGTVQEHILHIDLMNGSGAGDNQGEHGADRGRLDHRAEGLIVVNIESLGEAAKDLVSLVPFQRAIRVELVLKNPFASDNVGANGARDKISGVVGDQDNNFFFHGTTPVRINESSTNEGVHR